MTFNDEIPVPCLLAERAEREPDRPLVQVVGGPDYSSAEFHQTTLKWADALWTAGARKDDLVATMLPNSVDSYFCWIGLSWLRAPEVPINTDYKGFSLTYILNNSGAKILVISERFLDRLVEIADDLQSLETVWVPDASGSLPGTRFRMHAGAELFAEAKTAPYATPHYSDTHAVIYTSGTTGASKGVLQPWGGIQVMTEGIYPEDRPEGYQDGAIYTCWPTFHTTGRCGLSIGAQRNLRMVLRDSFSLSGFWDDIARYRCTHTNLLVVSSLLMRRPERPDDADNTLARVGMYPLIPAYRSFEKRFGVRVGHAYGMTEAGWVAATADPPNFQTSGRPLPGWHVRIVNEMDEELPVDAVGEITIRHDKPWRMTKGYLNMPQATADSWRNGWFHTGDAGRFDVDGHLYFVDRLKDSLRHRGHNVSSLEVESAVAQHPEVAECACVGVPSDLADPEDPVPDQDIKIFVVPAPESGLTEHRLHESLVVEMPKFMVPRYVKFVAALPRTPTNKVRKAQLRVLAEGDDHGWDSKAEIGRTS